jgi:hypothetical protein
LTRATTTLCEIATARQSAIKSGLAGPVETWSGAITRKKDAATDCVAANASPAGDVTMEVLPDCNAAVVGLEHRLWRSSGRWEDRGASLMVVVGPDRYGITVTAPGETSAKGKVPFPNEPLELKTELHATALEAEVTQLAEELRAFESDVAAALTATNEQDVRSFLGTAQKHLSRRAELEQRVRRLVAARARLRSSWRAEAFTLPDVETDRRLARLDTRLAQLRTEPSTSRSCSSRPGRGDRPLAQRRCHWSRPASYRRPSSSERSAQTSFRGRTRPTGMRSLGC